MIYNHDLWKVFNLPTPLCYVEYKYIDLKEKENKLIIFFKKIFNIKRKIKIGYLCGIGRN